MKTTIDDVAQALVALGRAEAFRWLVEALGDAPLLADLRARLGELATEDTQLAKGVGKILREAENAN